MAETPLANHPFLYHPRWSSLDVDIPERIKFILEERDRELEDYLGSLGSSDGLIGAQPSISLSRTSSYTSPGATYDIVEMTTVDWADTGAHESGGTIVVDTAGRWWVTGAIDITDLSDGVTYPTLNHAAVRSFHGSPSYFDGVSTIPGNLAGGFVTTAAVGAVFSIGGRFEGGVSPGFSAATLDATTPMMLQAFLLKEL